MIPVTFRMSKRQMLYTQNNLQWTNIYSVCIYMYMYENRSNDVRSRFYVNKFMFSPQWDSNTSPCWTLCHHVVSDIGYIKIWHSRWLVICGGGTRVSSCDDGIYLSFGFIWQHDNNIKHHIFYLLIRYENITSWWCFR